MDENKDRLEVLRKRLRGERDKPVWNSLETAKLIVAIFTPITVAWVGFLFQQQTARQNALVQDQIAKQNTIVQQQIAFQNRQFQSQQKLLDRRLQVYDSMRVELNRIFCFVEEIGTWKEDTPQTIIRYKRDLDQTVYTQSALWSVDTVEAYTTYIKAAFQTYSGPGKDAQIRSGVEQKMRIAGWQEDWREKFTGSRDREHQQKYNILVALISRDLYPPQSAK